jgi:hypothetical protein
MQRIAVTASSMVMTMGQPTSSTTLWENTISIPFTVPRLDILAYNWWTRDPMHYPDFSLNHHSISEEHPTKHITSHFVTQFSRSYPEQNQIIQLHSRSHPHVFFRLRAALDAGDWWFREGSPETLQPSIRRLAYHKLCETSLWWLPGNPREANLSTTLTLELL